MCWFCERFEEKMKEKAKEHLQEHDFDSSEDEGLVTLAAHSHMEEMIDNFVEKWWEERYA